MNSICTVAGALPACAMGKKKKDLEKRGRRKGSLTRRFTGLAEPSNFPSKEWVLLLAPAPKLSSFDSAGRTH